MENDGFENSRLEKKVLIERSCEEEQQLFVVVEN